jgi:serpin B
MKLETIKYNEYIKTYLDTLDEDDNNNLMYANSAWFNSITGNLEVNSNFENRIKEYLGTDIQMLIFNQFTKENLNEWINKQTNGFIDSLFVSTNSMDVMYMINAAAFNMDWQEAYGASNIKDGAFLNINKTVSTVEMMTSEEKYYIEDNNATGFVKEYSNPRYKFIALLPDKTTNVYAYLKGMSANSMNKILASIKEEKVTVTMPKFVAEQTTNLRNAYPKMGMTNLFTDYADYKGFMKNGKNIYLSKLFHKSKVEVGKTSTQGSGVSTINSAEGSADGRAVIINRPFFYMIYDSYQCLPVFMGVQQLM